MIGCTIIFILLKYNRGKFMTSNNIGKSISVLTDIKNNKTWSGSAATTVCDQLDDIIKSLDKEKNNIDEG